MALRSQLKLSIFALTLGASAAFLQACMGGDSSSPQQPETRTTSASQATQPQAFQALPAAPQIDPATQAARDRILGPNAVEDGKVKVWWAGVSSFVVSMKGHLFLLDAWEIVGLHANYLPIKRDDLAAIKPEAIFVGHGHFDHAADVGYVAGRSGAVVIAGETVCDTARQRAVSDGVPSNFPCITLGKEAEPAIGNTQSVMVWEDLPPVTVIKHPHSAAEPADLASGGQPQLYIPELLTYLTHINTNPREYLRFLQTFPEDGVGGEPDGGTWMFHFRVGEFSLLWHDSSGPISTDSPSGKEVQTALQNLPGCVDVQLNALVGFGLLTSGYRDQLLYIEHAKPKLTLPTHHDAWAPGIGGGAKAYEASWRKALSGLSNPPELDYLTDPQDYMKVREYSINDPRWSAPSQGSTCQ